MSSVMFLYSDISVLISLTFSLKNPIKIATPQGGQFKFSPISMYNCFQSFPLCILICVRVHICQSVCMCSICKCVPLCTCVYACMCMLFV